MQLKLKRSQRTGGALGGTVIFCLDVRVDLTPEEQQSVARYKLGALVVYQSEAKKRAQERGASAADGARFAAPRGGSVDDWLFAATDSIGGGMKALAFGAMAALSLKITINSLQQGQHIECKSLDELMGAEEAVMAACRNLRSYLDTASAFDGREIVVDFSGEEGVLVASATPVPALVVSGPVEPPRSPGATPAPAIAISGSIDPPPAAVATPPLASTPPPSAPYTDQSPPTTAIVTALDAVIQSMSGNASFVELEPAPKIVLIIGALATIFFVCSLLHVFILFTIVLMAGGGFLLKRALRL